MMTEYTPTRIVEKLNKYIIGQEMAKKAIAISIRNRYRRRNVPVELRDEIIPKNIIMIGPTGVGKTELARRLARLTGCPFIKVEVTKFTEVGYVGRDVESMIRDLVEASINLEKKQRLLKYEERIKINVEEILLDLLLPGTGESESNTREKFRDMLRNGSMDNKIVEIEIDESTHNVEVLSNAGFEEMGINISSMFGNLFPSKKKLKKVTISQAKEILIRMEEEKFVNLDEIGGASIKRTEEMGIIFLDEIDKIVRKQFDGRGPDVSREGVQRDLLPIVEGSTVNTKHGQVRTDHILFIAAGAFNISKPADMIPELQGRFPIRVSLNSLGSEELFRILKEPENALTLQYVELLKTDNVNLIFKEDGLREIASLAAVLNNDLENIGARRLHTILEKVLEDVLFEAPYENGEELIVDSTFVKRKMDGIVNDLEMAKYIL
ncbi:ATP-dependent protease ATPase subunit HslU [bacterium]|nr:ATP-dependent protease ATPase subunit HslU [bacterium]